MAKPWRATKKQVCIELVSRKGGATLEDMMDEIVRRGIDYDRLTSYSTCMCWMSKLDFKVSYDRATKKYSRLYGPAGLDRVSHRRPKKLPDRTDYAGGPPDLEKRTSLVALLGEIPMDAWDRVVLDEPEWKMMEPFLRSYGFGPFSVLMMVVGLNDFQNKGRAEVGFWPP